MWGFGLDPLLEESLFVWEEELLGELMALLAPAAISTSEDRWYWEASCDGIYSVKSAYERLLNYSPSLVARDPVVQFALDK